LGQVIQCHSSAKEAASLPEIALPKGTQGHSGGPSSTRRPTQTKQLHSHQKLHHSHSLNIAESPTCRAKRAARALSASPDAGGSQGGTQQRSSIVTCAPPARLTAHGTLNCLQVSLWEARSAARASQTLASGPLAPPAPSLAIISFSPQLDQPQQSMSSVLPGLGHKACLPADAAHHRLAHKPANRGRRTVAMAGKDGAPEPPASASADAPAASPEAAKTPEAPSNGGKTATLTRVDSIPVVTRGDGSGGMHSAAAAATAATAAAATAAATCSPSAVRAASFCCRVPGNPRSAEAPEAAGEVPCRAHLLLRMLGWPQCRAGVQLSSHHACLPAHAACRTRPL